MGNLFGSKKVSSPKPKEVSVVQAQSAADTAKEADDAEARRKRAALASNTLFGDTTSAADTNINQKKNLLGL